MVDFYQSTASKLVLAAGMLLASSLVPPTPACARALQDPDSSPSPAAPKFSTQAPLSGKINESFFVLLPLVNTGTATADHVQITSASLGTAKLTSPKLPLLRGPYAPSDPDTLVLQFDAHDLTVGLRYLLAVGGTYQLKGHAVAFAVSLYLKVATPDSADQIEIEHAVAIDAVSQKLQSLPGSNPAADNQELLTFVRSRPEFINSGVNKQFSSVWATFANGEPYIIVNDRVLPAKPANVTRAVTSMEAAPDSQNQQLPPQTPLPASAAAAPTTGLPLSKKALFMNVFGSLAATNGDAIVDIKNWMHAQHYDPKDGTFSVASLMNGLVFDDGVLYLATHGGVDDEGKLFALYTTDNTTPALDAFFRETYQFGKTIVKMTAQQGKFDVFAHKWVEATHYGITAAFVRKYFLFGPNSFVLVNGCSSAANNPLARDFRQAFWDAGASVYAGWTADGDEANSSSTAKLIFDRLLGANQFALETGPTASGAVFKQRPFDWNSAAFDAILHDECPGSTSAVGTKCGYDAETGAFLIIAANPKSESKFNLLAPSIGRMMMDELNNELTISGIFDSEEPTVMVGGSIDNSSGVPVVSNGQEVKVVSWSPSQIVVELPVSGVGSSGNVQVVVRDHVSNVAQLTEWRGKPDQVSFTLTGAGNLQQEQKFGLHLRADIRQWRKEIHSPPVEPQGILIAASDSTATISSKGSATFAGQTETWKGSDTLIVGLSTGLTGVTDNSFVLVAQFSDSKDIIFALDDIASHGGTCQICDQSGCSTSPLWATGPFGWFSIWQRIPAYSEAHFETDGNSVSIKGDTMSRSGVGDCTPNNNQTLHGMLTWNAISSTPGTAPDPDSAR